MQTFDERRDRNGQTALALPPQKVVAPAAHTSHSSEGLLLPWSWCSCCQRAFVRGTFRRLHIAGTGRRPQPKVIQQCPYQDCWGQILRDSRPWASIRQAHAGYPEQPERYVVYAHQSAKEA